MISLNYRHGEAFPIQTIEYRAWARMMQRCYNPNDPSFKYYGKRGILVSEDWHDFEKFLASMGRRPKNKNSIGRKDSNGNYNLGNCEWQTYTEQNRNRRTVKMSMLKAREIRMLWNKGYSQRDLAKEFRCNCGTISLIVNNKQWKENR